MWVNIKYIFSVLDALIRSALCSSQPSVSASPSCSTSSPGLSSSSASKQVLKQVNPMRYDHSICPSTMNASLSKLLDILMCKETEIFAFLTQENIPENTECSEIEFLVYLLLQVFSAAAVV